MSATAGGATRGVLTGYGGLGNSVAWHAVGGVAYSVFVAIVARYVTGLRLCRDTGEQWSRRASDSGIAPLVKFAKALKKRLRGILAHCRWRLRRSVFAPPPPPQLFIRKALTAQSERPVGAPAHAVAYTTAAAIRGAGSVRRPRLTTGAPAAGVAGHSDSLLANHRPVKSGTSRKRSVGVAGSKATHGSPVDPKGGT